MTTCQLMSTCHLMTTCQLELMTTYCLISTCHPISTCHQIWWSNDLQPFVPASNSRLGPSEYLKVPFQPFRVHISWDHMVVSLLVTRDPSKRISHPKTLISEKEPVSNYWGVTWIVQLNITSLYDRYYLLLFFFVL